MTGTNKGQKAIILRIVFLSMDTNYPLHHIEKKAIFNIHLLCNDRQQKSRTNVKTCRTPLLNKTTVHDGYIENSFAKSPRKSTCKIKKYFLCRSFIEMDPINGNVCSSEILLWSLLFFFSLFINYFVYVDLLGLMGLKMNLKQVPQVFLNSQAILKKRSFPLVYMQITCYPRN